MDLDDLEHNTRDGLHMASLAGSWLARGGRVRRLSRPRGPASPSTRGCRLTSSAWPSGSCCAGAGCAWRSCRARRATSWSTASRSSCATMTRRSRSSAGAPQAHPWRAPERRGAAPRSPRIARPPGGGRAGPADRRRGAKVARSWSAAATGPTKDPPWTPPARGLSRPPATLGCIDGDRDRPREEGPPRLWIRRCRDRALPAHARPRRRRHLLEARRLPLRAAAAGLGHGRRRVARDGEDRRQARRPGRPQPRGHLDALRGRRRAARAHRAAPQGRRHARDAGDLPGADQARAHLAAHRGDQGRAGRRRRRLAHAPARRRATTSSRSRRGSTSSSSRARSSRPSTSRRPPSR